ncbi:hypothetical protein I302_101378 [Kwoniella bestiolae CBS 10118]|uniref:Uncharacterized protein n=1 Tax=Kwoniella bestiolae CBS 10118 TaxID=1296100 RepID=A0A1B9GC31_9TREE|nr:hypothetical protein I302_00061 [Kwoniella bestiolae CBS 10118]OCF28573.1 hypothetical protein I302_00061 [Kwoniella bestiolae CBS 10118]
MSCRFRDYLSSDEEDPTSTTSSPRSTPSLVWISDISSSSNATPLRPYHPINSRDVEMVWSIPHLQDTILSHLKKEDQFNLIRVNRSFFTSIIRLSGIYRTIPHQIYAGLLAACPKERRDIDFDAVRTVDLYSHGRPPQPARWEAILMDLPNVENISRGDTALYRSSKPGKFRYEYEYRDIIILGEPHSRLYYPSFVPKEWILGPILHITISDTTAITDIEEQARVFKDSLSTRVKALEGRLDTLKIDLPLPTQIIRETLQELQQYGYEALKIFSMVQKDTEVLEYLQDIPESVLYLTISSRRSATTFISLMDFMKPEVLVALQHINELRINLILPNYDDLPTVQFPNAIFPQDVEPVHFLRTSKTKLQLVFPVVYPLDDPRQLPVYLNFIRRLARYIFPLLDEWDVHAFDNVRPSINIPHDGAIGWTFTKNIVYQSTTRLEESSRGCLNIKSTEV